MRQLSVVRQKQQAGRILVQPPDGCKAAVLRRQQLHHGAIAGIVRRGHIARRLMQQQNDRPARADRLAVERDPVRCFVDLLLGAEAGTSLTRTRPARMMARSSRREATPASDKNLSRRCIRLPPSGITVPVGHTLE